MSNALPNSIYAKDNWHLNDQWILVLGGRYQRYDQYLDQGLGSSYNRLIDDQGQAFLPFVGVVFAATDKLSLYAKLQRVVQAQPVRQPV